MHPARRRLAVFLSAAIAAVLAVLLPGTAAPAAAASAAGNGVGASRPVMILPVGASHPVSAGERRCRAASQPWFAAGACVAPEAVTPEAVDAGTGAGVSRGPSFIVHPNGEAIRIPEGATGPTPAESGRGFQFTGGSGGGPLSSRVAGVRVMEPGYSGKYFYPNGYVSYFNEAGQTVNPFTGQTIARSDPFWHWEWGS